MEQLPNDREAPRLSKPPAEIELLDFPVRQRWDEKQEAPEHSRDVTSDRRHQEPGHDAAREHDEGGATPAVISRVAQARDAHQHYQGRDDRDEEQDVVEVDQGLARWFL